MNKKSILLLVPFFLLLTGVAIVAVKFSTPAAQIINEVTDELGEDVSTFVQTAHPLSIASLRAGEYPAGEIVIEETLSPGSNYQRYIASYQSEGNKIYALLTIPNPVAGPNKQKPATGWPVVIFNHGYIPPAQYRTTERYIAYTDAFSRNGYIVFRSDYRGHGSSEGVASGGYGSNGYTIDILNALASIKTLKDPKQTEGPILDANRIGMWGHSMGGHITLRNMVVSKDIKAGVIWAGVVASYPDLLNNWRRRNPSPTTSLSTTPSPRGWRQSLTEQYGTPETNSAFWDSISANSFLTDVSGPIQIHHGTADTSVPVEFSEKLDQQLKAVGKESELYIYQGDDHNLSRSFSTAMNRSVAFFDKYVKNAEQPETPAE